MAENLPPIHDFVRFWHRTEAATLAACISFRRTPLPGWTLGWLRHAAPIIMTRELSEAALRRAVREKVFPDAQPSVQTAVGLFCRFAEKHKWKGKSLSPRVCRLPSGAAIRTEAIGRYFSQATEKEWLVALQPRQDDYPNDEQFKMWRSALCYEFGQSDEATMIIDLSKNPVSGKRELHEITSRKHPIIGLTEFNERLELVAFCYNRAVEIVPERPRRKPKEDDEPTLDI